MTMIIAKFGAD